MSVRPKREHLRQRIAYEAARLMVEEAISDHELARRKAAARMGVPNSRLWPSNAEVQEALSQQQRLFQPSQPESLRNLRQTALQAMQALARFRPRLVGPVLDGTADRGSRVTLHLFAEVPDEVAHALLERRIPWKERTRNLRYAGGERRPHPVFQFVAGGVGVELVVLPALAQRNPPLGPVTERPERGGDIEQVRSLLDADPGPEGYRWEIGT
jgi:hypothetical protein